MKKIFLYSLLGGQLIFTACGSSQEELRDDKKEEEVKEVKKEDSVETYKEQEMPTDSTQKDSLKTNK